MSSQNKIEKILFFASLSVFLPMAFLLIGEEASTPFGLLRISVPLLCCGAIILIVFSFGQKIVGRQIKFRASEETIQGLFHTAFGLQGLNALGVVIVAFTIGYQPWLVWMVGGIFMIGFFLFSTGVFLRGMKSS